MMKEMVKEIETETEIAIKQRLRVNRDGGHRDDERDNERDGDI